MAKKTAKKAAPSMPAAAKTSSPAKASSNGAKTAVVKQAATAAGPAMSCDQIGYAAGDVWGALHGKGWQTLAAVKKASGCPADLTLMGIGWLAREGKLDFAVSGRSVKITLK